MAASSWQWDTAAVKSLQVSAALQRIAGVPDISDRMRPIVGAVEQYHYRNKLEVRLRRAECDVGDVDAYFDCPVHMPTLSSLLQSCTSTPVSHWSLVVSVNEGGPVLQFTFSGQRWLPADAGVGGGTVPAPALGFVRPGHPSHVRSVQLSVCSEHSA